VAQSGRSKGPLQDPGEPGQSAGDADPDPPTLPGMDRRVAPRYLIDAPVRIRVGNVCKSGKVRDMSSTGVRIEDVDLQPPEGTRLQLEFSFFKDSPAVPLAGEVVRKTDTGGFCVEFRAVDPRTKAVLRVVLPKVAGERTYDEQITTYSGEFVARVGRELHREFGEAARASGLQVNEWIKDRLRAAAEADLAEARKKHDPRTCPGCRSGQRH
jgi:hypothetical protein